MVVVVLRLFILSEESPVLLVWVESPLYVAVILMVPAVAVEDGVYVTAQLLVGAFGSQNASVQDDEPKVPPLPPSLQTTLPVGGVGIVAGLVTVAL